MGYNTKHCWPWLVPPIYNPTILYHASSLSTSSFHHFSNIAHQQITMSSQIFDFEIFHFLSKLGPSTGPGLELILGIVLFVFISSFWLAPGGLDWDLSKTRTTIPSPSG